MGLRTVPAAPLPRVRHCDFSTALRQLCCLHKGGCVAEGILLQARRRKSHVPEITRHFDEAVLPRNAAARHAAQAASFEDEAARHAAKAAWFEDEAARHAAQAAWFVDAAARHAAQAAWFEDEAARHAA
jgi:hypothetical protein